METVHCGASDPHPPHQHMALKQMESGGVTNVIVQCPGTK